MINVANNIMYYKIIFALLNVIKDILMIHSFAKRVLQDAYNATLKIITNVQYVMQTLY